MKFNINSISKAELLSIKESFFHIYHSVLNEDFLSKDFVGCLFKWGIQLHISEEELKFIDPNYVEKEIPNKEKALEHLFNLVYMIYLDGEMEDNELKVVAKYAEKNGFQSHIVNDLLKTIVTAPYDGFDFSDLKVYLKEILDDAQD